jgi:hypothetical protein
LTSSLSLWSTYLEKQLARYHFDPSKVNDMQEVNNNINTKIDVHAKFGNSKIIFDIKSDINDPKDKFDTFRRIRLILFRCLITYQCYRCAYKSFVYKMNLVKK